VYLTEVEEYVNAKVGGNWQEQRDRDNLNNFVTIIIVSSKE